MAAVTEMPSMAPIQRKELNLKSKDNESMRPGGEEKLPEGETEGLIQQHILSKRPAVDDEPIPSKKQKELKDLEGKLDAGADNEVQLEIEPIKMEANVANAVLNEAANLSQQKKRVSANDEGEETGCGSKPKKSVANRSFERLRTIISAETMKAVDRMGFKDMTEIQAKAIPKLLEGQDLRGTAKTGAGKTLAFVIPAVELMHKHKYKPSDGTGVLILSPTRELSMQTLRVLREVMADHTQTCGLTIGGTNLKSEAGKLAKGVNILVATPGRLLHHLQSTPKFVYKNLVCLIIDEADRILDAGFEKQMKQVLSLLPKQRQTMLFSATKDDKTNNLAKLALKTESVEVDVDSDKDSATVEGLEQAYLVCPADKRFLVLHSFIKKNINKKVMVFFSSCKAVKFYNEILNKFNLPVTCIHGRQKQTMRTTNFNSFCKAESGTLLCTDVAARGWDIPNVDLIVQYDPPNDPKEYIHRVGRTARAGGQGHALLFVCKQELGFVRYLQQNKVNVETMDITWTEVTNIQPQLQKLIAEDTFLYASAKSAFVGFLRAYKTHQQKNFFNIKSLDLMKVSTCFGFHIPPFRNLAEAVARQIVKKGGGGGLKKRQKKAKLSKK